MKSSDFELLLPVGQIEMAKAAIHNGADAIYVGFPGFNARGRSYDFELEELRHIIELCHSHGVKVNLAFNILIFENELPAVVEAIQKVLPLKPDALIVQDLGLVKIVKTMCPEQVIHASTQMTVTNELAMSFLEDLDIKRFVLGRENSISEIKLITERSQKELEVFVHGALCVSYSGQCFTSETLGGRSANRGQCAQSCRFSYDLIVDGATKNMVDRNYLVSPQDLCGLAEIPELMKLGVKSFKVEGRLKSPEYVAQVAKSYRKVIDLTLEQRDLSEKEVQSEKSKMAVEYSRGFFSGWLHGVDHQNLVDGTFSSHRGLHIGTVTSVYKNTMSFEIMDAALDLENGDGVSWLERGEKKGSSIYSLRRKGQGVEVALAPALRIEASAIGSPVYLTHDRSQKKEIERTLTDREMSRKSPVSVHLTLSEGQPLRAVVQDGRFTVTMETESLLQRAEKRPLSAELLLEEFSSLSQTALVLLPESFRADISGDLFLNHKEIKNLRQNIFAELMKKRRENRIDFDREFALTEMKWPVREPVNGEEPSSQMGLNVLLRNKEQVWDFVAGVKAGELEISRILSVCLDFEFGRDYQGSVEKIKSLSIPVGIATTRILKPQEYINLKIIHSLNPDFILIRNLGALYYFKNVQEFKGRLKGDFSLNVTNHQTFDYLLKKGLDSVCLSYDLNFDQTVSLLENIDAARAEITIHQSMPSFHMEHCVFAAFLSQGKSYRDCGKPCEKHKVQLKDQFGNYHWIKPDQECRNTMYNASAQTALPYLNDWKRKGLGEIRFEALHESGAELIRKIKNYTDVLQGRRGLDEALKDLKTTEVYGLSPRQLNRAEEYQGRKKDHSFL